MLFKKKPENDINQYFVLVSRSGKMCGYISVQKRNPKIHGTKIPSKKEDPLCERITVKKAVKRAMKQNALLYLLPELLDEYIIKYFEEKVPHQYWCWSPMSIHLVN